MSENHRFWTRFLASAVLVVAVSATLFAASDADAADSHPCGPATKVSWSGELVQQCPLANSVNANGWIPVYADPVPNPRGSNPPPPAGWLHGTSGQYFVCQRAFTSAVFYHPGGFRNYWWGYTLSDDGIWGWVPQVFFTGGLDDEPDAGLRACPIVAAAPSVPLPPAPAPALCDPVSGVSNLRLTATFKSRKKRVTTRFDTRLAIGGRLTDQAGTPVAGANLCVGEIDPGAGALRRTASVSTDADGRFRYRLARGVSRRVWFVHRSAGAEASTSVFVQVRAPASLRAKPKALRNGQTVLLRGRIGGGPVARGVLVEVQAKRGNGYQTFATTNAHKRGGFRFRYRFTRTLGVQRYQLRVKVPRQLGYPYAGGASRPVAVTVRGFGAR